MTNSQEKPKVVLFIAHFGDGHRQVARALRQEYEELGATVIEVDCLRTAHPRYSRLSEWTFEFLTKQAPSIYGWSHQLTRNLRSDNWFWKALSSGPHRTAHEVIAREKPDIALQLFPEHTLTELQHVPRRPVTGVVLTDYSIHSRWFCPEVDVYYLPHESLIPEATRFADTERFIASGIPIREQFHLPLCNPEGPRGEGEHHRQHIVVATGGRGVFPHLDETLKELLEGSKGRKVFVLCGRNEGMYAQVQELARRIQEVTPEDAMRLQPLGFIEDVASLLRGAAYAVVKAGGVTVTECINSACPMVFYRPALGQERDNALWVEKFQAGKIVYDIKQVGVIARELEMDGVLDRMSITAASLSHGNAAKMVVADTMRRFLDRSFDG